MYTPVWVITTSRSTSCYTRITQFFFITRTRTRTTYTPVLVMVITMSRSTIVYTRITQIFFITRTRTMYTPVWDIICFTTTTHRYSNRFSRFTHIFCNNRTTTCCSARHLLIIKIFIYLLSIIINLYNKLQIILKKL